MDWVSGRFRIERPGKLRFVHVKSIIWHGIARNASFNMPNGKIAACLSIGITLTRLYIYQRTNIHSVGSLSCLALRHLGAQPGCKHPTPGRRRSMPARAVHTAALGPAQHTQYKDIPSRLL